jgi:hypothetical protein
LLVELTLAQAESADTADGADRDGDPPRPQELGSAPCGDSAAEQRGEGSRAEGGAELPGHLDNGTADGAFVRGQAHRRRPGERGKAETSADASQDPPREDHERVVV